MQYMISFELRHEKTNNLHLRKQRRRSASRYSKADQSLCFCYIDLLSKSEISSLKPSCVAIQPGLCRMRSETRTLVFSQCGSFKVVGFFKMDGVPVVTFFSTAYLSLKQILKYAIVIITG